MSATGYWGYRRFAKGERSAACITHPDYGGKTRVDLYTHGGCGPDGKHITLYAATTAEAHRHAAEWVDMGMNPDGDPKDLPPIALPPDAGAAGRRP